MSEHRPQRYHTASQGALLLPADDRAALALLLLKSLASETRDDVITSVGSSTDPIDSWERRLLERAPVAPPEPE